jgi:uncharacterized membrane protein
VKVDRSPLTLLLLLLVMAASQLLHYYPKLPEMVAVHFGASGAPNGWSGKTAFFVTYAVVEAAMAIAATAMVFFGERLPVSFLNMPNRDYWLAQERRGESLGFLWTRTIWIEVTTLAFLIVVAQFIFRANLAGGGPRLTGDFALVIIAFVAAVIWQSVDLIRRFSRPTA